MPMIASLNRVDPGFTSSRPIGLKPAEVFRLENGLTLIYQPLAFPVVAVDVWVAAGAAVDPWQQAGMAHFLEHLIFKGTHKTAPGVFDRLVEGCGGATNAATAYDYAHFYITLAAEQLEAVLPTFADLLLNAAIPKTEFEAERQVVLEELRQAQDDPDWVGFQALLEQVYAPDLEHPYRRPILGTEAQLLTQSPEAVRQFHRSHYRPENLTVVVAGGVGRDRTLSLFNTHFGAANPGPKAASPPFRLPVSPTAPIPASSPPTDRSPVANSRPLRQTLLLPNLEQTRLMLAWPGPGNQQPEAGAGLDLLAAILTEGRLSRLVKALREERRWVSDVECDYSSDRLGGLLTLTAWLEPEYLAPVEAFIREQILALQQHLVTPAELHRVQIQLTREFAFSLETPSDFAELYGYANTVADLATAFDYPIWIERCTPADLQRLAQDYLLLDHCCVTVLCPED